jgi:replication factor A1
MNISEIRTGMRKIDVEGIITEQPKAREVFTKKGPFTVANVTLADDTGEIVLTLWNEEITKVKLGDRVKITNGYSDPYQGKDFLKVGKFGRLEVIA